MLIRKSSSSLRACLPFLPLACWSKPILPFGMNEEEMWKGRACIEMWSFQAGGVCTRRTKGRPGSYSTVQYSTERGIVQKFCTVRYHMYCTLLAGTDTVCNLFPYVMLASNEWLSTQRHRPYELSSIRKSVPARFLLRSNKVRPEAFGVERETKKRQCEMILCAH